MNIHQEAALAIGKYHSRRYFLKQCMGGLGAMALGSLMDLGKSTIAPKLGNNLGPHFPPTAKQVIFLHMARAAS